MIRIGFIEDNRDFRAEVTFYLSHMGFEIVFESDGHDVDDLLKRHKCDIVILDLTLPGADGLDIAKHMRDRYPHIGIVMLTARTTSDDRLKGLCQGADAYLSKPVDMRELIAVIQNIYRRLEAASKAKTQEKPWLLDLPAFRFISPKGKSIPLTVTEQKLLQRLGSIVGSPVSRSELAISMGYADQESNDRRLEVTISRLRQKIESVAPGCDIIRAARSQGYILAATIETR